MSNRPFVAALAVALICGCGTSPKPTSEVAKLKAQANDNPMLAPWSGPYGGVPPWDQVKAELLPGRVRARARAAPGRGRRHRRRTPSRRVRQRDRGARGRRPAREPRRDAVRRADQQPEHPGRAGGRSRVVAEDRRGERQDHVQREALRADLGGVRGARDGRAHAGAEAAARAHLRTRTSAPAPSSSPDQKKRLGEINQELAVAFTDFGNKVLGRREHLGRPRRSRPTWPACRTRCARPTRRPPRSGSSPGKWAWSTRARASIRSCRHRPGATCARRCGRRSRAAATTATPTTPTRRSRRSSSCAPSARRCSGYAVARALAHVRHDGEGPGEGPRADDAGVAGGGRARPRGGRRHAGDREERRRRASRSSRGTTSTTPRRCARRSTTSTRASSSRTSSSNNMIAGVVLDGRASSTA